MKITLRDLLEVGGVNPKKQYTMEDFELVDKTQTFIACVVFFKDANGVLGFQNGFNKKQVSGAYVLIQDKNSSGIVPGITLDTSIEEIFNYTYNWYGVNK